jgi:hypothetical protein
MANKQELIHFLEQRVFNPILRAKPDDYSERDRAALEHVQKSTASEKDRYHQYGSAGEVVINSNGSPLRPCEEDRFGTLAFDAALSARRER